MGEPGRAFGCASVLLVAAVLGGIWLGWVAAGLLGAGLAAALALLGCWLWLRLAK